jgi:hypothetical protein
MPWPRPPPETISPDFSIWSGKISASDIVEAMVFPIKRKNVRWRFTCPSLPYNMLAFKEHLLTPPTGRRNERVG